jgi:hypothetical protein
MKNFPESYWLLFTQQLSHIWQFFRYNNRINWELSILASLLAAILYQGNHDMNHKLLNIVSTEPLVQ